jgi:GNAT superfamily N-acetyltransferase
MDSVVSLRAMRADDISAGLRLCRASGWNQLAPDWERFLGSNPAGCQVAVDHGGAVIGSVATLRFGSTFAWIAMVLVDPAHRRAGVGTRLLEQALLILQDMPAVRLDATPAGFHVYEPAGFREEYRLQRMERAAVPAVVTPSSAWVRLMDATDLDEVFEWDKRVFGADRRALLESFRRQAPTYAWISVGRDLVGRDFVRRDLSRALPEAQLPEALPGSIIGYTFGRPGYMFEHIGPIVARDEDIASSLVSHCLAAHPNRRFIVDVPLQRSWVGRLESQQFVLQRPFIRMRRGDWRCGDPPAEMFAIAGPEFA